MKVLKKEKTHVIKYLKLSLTQTVRELKLTTEKINFNDNSFDYIFSQQVIEHVESNLLESYLSEEKRILKKNGLVFHQIPHRLGPFEGHTKKWFIHWLPKKLYFLFFKG